MTETTGHVGDRRRAPFCYQTHDALDAIRARFAGTRRSTAIAVYVVLTETANRNGGAAAREDGFQASRQEIAEAVGIGVDALDGYVKVLAEIGLVEVERRRIGKVNLPNVWTLVSGPPSPPSRPESATLADSGRPLARDPLSSKETNLEEGTPLTPRARVRDHWLGLPGMTQHRPSYFDQAIQRKIDKAVAKYGLDDVLAAMTAYAEVLASPVHFWRHRWTLGDFLTRGLDRFVPEAEPLRVFLTTSSKPGGLSAEEIALQAVEAKEDGR